MAIDILLLCPAGGFLYQGLFGHALRVKKSRCERRYGTYLRVRVNINLAIGYKLEHFMWQYSGYNLFTPFTGSIRAQRHFCCVSAKRVVAFKNCLIQ